MIKCPNCSHENDEATMICESCGQLLVEPTTATKKYDDADYQQGVPRWGSARFKGAMDLVLDVVDTKHTFVFAYEEIDTIIIGRKDPKEKNDAFLDLTTIGGLDKGVSRIHAHIQQTPTALEIVDKGSSNGTYLNGQKLLEDQPRVLRDGDEVRLGFLKVRVTFRPAN